MADKKKDGGMTPVGEVTEKIPLEAGPTVAVDEPERREPPAEDPNDEGRPSTAILAPPGAVVRRETLAGTDYEQTGETAPTALAAQAQAEVQSRFLVAMRRPRNIELFRQRLLEDCRRPGFAEKAEYEKPIGGGKKARGASIRFIEAALRHFGNVVAGSAAIYDDPRKRIVRVTVTDLEVNFTIPKDVTIEKTVERSKPRQGENGPEYFSVRTNTRGEKTYEVPATEDDMLMKENNLISKAMRTNGERLLPADIKEEALIQCRRTLVDRAAKDPAAERRSVSDAFFGLNITVADLQGLIGHDLDKATPAELVELRRLFVALREGEVNWGDLLRAKEKETEKKTSKAQTLVERLGGSNAKPAAEAAPPQPPPTQPPA